MVKGIWWKIVGPILILYSLVMGLSVPLNTGIVDIEPRNAREGDSLVLQVGTYNTEYRDLKDTELVSAWLKAGDDQVFQSTGDIVCQPVSVRPGTRLFRFALSCIH